MLRKQFSGAMQTRNDCHSDKLTYVRGAAFCGDQLLQDSDLERYFGKVNDVQGFARAVKCLNGFFVVVLQRGTEIFAAVDCIRSIPLYYVIDGDSLYISDDANWIKAFTIADVPECLTSVEFLLTGYVTGSDTLCPGVFQIQAGELLTASMSSEPICISKERYSLFAHHRAEPEDEKPLLDELDRVMMSAIHRLACYADGRTIAIPLSGGLDSRLIAFLVKRIQYPKVVAYSYGRPDNKESQTSKQVASLLGVPWYFVPYNTRRWKQWSRTEERMGYFHMAHGLSSVPHIQDWPAVWELTYRYPEFENAIFVPGHTGDFVAGSHIPKDIQRLAIMDSQGFADLILEKHYALWNRDKYSRCLPLLRERILTVSECSEKTMDGLGAINAFERWVWQERQAKFIVNSVRVYEFWGQKWWLPFWDREVMDFWCKVPLCYRIDKKLYIEYVESVSEKVPGFAPLVQRERKHRKKFSIMQRASRLIGGGSLYRTILSRRRCRSGYRGHPMGMHGLVDEHAFQRLYTGNETIASFLSEVILRDWETYCRPTSEVITED